MECLLDLIVLVEFYVVVLVDDKLQESSFDKMPFCLVVSHFNSLELTSSIASLGILVELDLTKFHIVGLAILQYLKDVI